MSINIVTSVILAHCGPSSNPWPILSLKSQQDAYDVHLSLAQAYYDDENIDEALKHAEKAIELNPFSENAAVLLGFVYLAKSGLMPFTLMEKMNKDEYKDKKTQTEKKSTETTNANQEANANSDDQENEDSGGLSTLGSIIGITEDEFTQLGTLNYDDPDLPIIEPVCAGKAREVVEKLKFMYRAIMAICPFVDEQVLIPGDERHACQRTEYFKTRTTETHFIWMFAHLVEALAFHSVVTYSTNDLGKTNLELRVKKLEEIDVNNASDIPALIESLQGTVETIDKVLNIVGECSPEYPQTQLAALVNDLVSVSLAMGRMPGLPPSITTTLNQSIGKISEFKKKSAEISDSRSKALSIKGQLTKGMAGVVGKAIDSIDSTDFSQEQAEQACAAYEQITGGAKDDANKPSICSGL